MGKLREAAAELHGAQKEGLFELIKNMPEPIEEKVRIIKKSAGDILVRMQDTAKNVYILLEGDIKAMNQQVSGAVYVFATFSAPSLFGEFEAFSQCSYYRGTLTCVTKCTLAVMPTEAYLNWMRKDHEALFQRTQQITKQLVDQAGSERNFLFFTGKDRLVAFLISCYQKTQVNGMCHIKVTRQQIADETGFCVKTVQRGLNQLKRKGMLTFDRREIVINQEQYRQLDELASEKIN
ncbi:Crp/Fnr family transcriptional regulator [Hydrogenoanaerobacterium sp.]|uniref:Crp/Fnr family transcriptional regulator n=1 Tax=Hydrogenoanaerobacterium sp. TaxID=2953763 RepID=UPI0028A0D171|nr:Crp/Fnr family transcriptional regulator [Hydrogenoanaerobacterium sp.]